MRLRNIKGAIEAIQESDFVVHEEKEKRGKWVDVFHNTNPIYIEVGMGKGRFIMDQAALHPEINYVGIEMYDSVLLRALQKMQERAEEGTLFPNLLFMKMDARELPLVFELGEVKRIYLNFSDPWPKERHAKRRLTSHQFLERYDAILTPDGVIEFKTDNRELFDFSLEEVKASKWELLASTFDLHQQKEMMGGNVMTEYEEKFSGMGNPIHKLIITRKVL